MIIVLQRTLFICWQKLAFLGVYVWLRTLAYLKKIKTRNFLKKALPAMCSIGGACQPVMYQLTEAEQCVERPWRSVMDLVSPVAMKCLCHLQYLTRFETTASRFRLNNCCWSGHAIGINYNVYLETKPSLQASVVSYNKCDESKDGIGAC
jgi:hypothetical protein